MQRGMQAGSSQAGRQACSLWKANRQTHRHTDGQTERQTDVETDRQTHRHSD